MSLSAISNQDLANSIDELKALMLAGFETMNARFDRLEERVERLEEKVERLEARMERLEGRMDRLENRIDALEVAQRETNVRLARIEGTIEAHHADIKELYQMIAELKKRFGKQLQEREDLDARVHKVEAFAREVSAQTGIRYPRPKP